MQKFRMHNCKSVLFGNLDPGQKYFPMVAENSESTFYGIAPRPIYPPMGGGLFELFENSENPNRTDSSGTCDGEKQILLDAHNESGTSGAGTRETASPNKGGASVMGSRGTPTQHQLDAVEHSPGVLAGQPFAELKDQAWTNWERNQFPPLFKPCTPTYSPLTVSSSSYGGRGLAKSTR